jgi:hypothetical protein
MDEACLKLLVTALRRLWHDSQLKLFYPIFFIVQQVRHAASSHHVGLAFLLGCFLSLTIQHILKPPIAIAFYSERIAFHTSSYFRYYWKPLPTLVTVRQILPSFQAKFQQPSPLLQPKFPSSNEPRALETLSSVPQGVLCALQYFLQRE